MITIEQLQVDYGTTRALDLQGPIRIHPGERIGIIGSNGAGKTTLLNALLGLIPSKGKYSISATREHIAVHMQQNRYVETMAVRHIIETITGSKLGKDEKLDELIAFFDFESSLKKRFQHLSGGQQQRLTLILVLYQDAPLVFFDEVTSGLDFESRQSLVDRLVRWYDRSQTTLCYITHYYEELETLVDKILMIEDGKLVCFGEKSELFERYCGRSVYVLNRTPENEALVKGFSELKAPDHLIALSSPDERSDKLITQRLSEANASFRRSTHDVEIMSYNAKVDWRNQ